MCRPRPLRASTLLHPNRDVPVGPPAATGGLAVDLGSTDIKIGRLVVSARPFGVPSYPCAGVDLGLLNTIVVTVVRSHSAAKRGRGVCTWGGELHSCLARARARALRRGLAEL